MDGVCGKERGVWRSDEKGVWSVGEVSEGKEWDRNLAG